MGHLWRNLVAVILVWLCGRCLVCMPAWGREVKLTLHPQKLPAEPNEYSLLPRAATLVDGDAVTWYEKALQALPDKAETEQIRQWLDMPVEQLPVEQAEKVLQRYLENLRYAARGARCRECNWPLWEPGMPPRNDDRYRVLTYIVCLWARLEIAQGGYDGAVLAIQTGLGMTRHLGQAPTLIQVLTAIALGAMMCQEIEQFVQAQDAPNLYGALASLPKPFMEVEKAIESEKKPRAADPKAGSAAGALDDQMKQAYDRIRTLARKLDSHLAVLQCVEAIRAYAASHGGQLPARLDDITETPVANDPLTAAPFRYTRTDSTAVLESVAPSDSEKKEDHLRLVITLGR